MKCSRKHRKRAVDLHGLSLPPEYNSFYEIGAAPLQRSAPRHTRNEPDMHLQDTRWTPVREQGEA